MYRQGDLLFIKINQIPKKRKRKLKTDVLARGEATGHVHRLVNGTLYRAANELGRYRTFIHARKGTKVIHDEHDEIILPVGYYLLVRQREYDPNFTNGMDVAD